MTYTEENNYNAVKSFMETHNLSLGKLIEIEYFYDPYYFNDNNRGEIQTNDLRHRSSSTKLLVNEDIYQLNIVLPEFTSYKSFSTQYQQFVYKDGTLVIASEDKPYVLILW